jgi:hypothetical protein
MNPAPDWLLNLKSREQEKLYHAQIGDIARQWTHAGRKWDADDMKRLLVDAFWRDTKADTDLRDWWATFGDLRLAPAINSDGFVALGYPTRKFPKPLASAFIEWLYAFGVEAGIVWSRDAQRPRERINPETGEIKECST